MRVSIILVKKAYNFTSYILKNFCHNIVQNVERLQSISKKRYLLIAWQILIFFLLKHVTCRWTDNVWQSRLVHNILRSFWKPEFVVKKSEMKKKVQKLYSSGTSWPICIIWTTFEPYGVIWVTGNRLLLMQPRWHGTAGNILCLKIAFAK